MKTHTTIPVLKYARFAVPAMLPLALWFLRTPLKPVLDFLKDQEAVSAKLHELGAFGPLVMFGLLVAQVFLATIPGHAVMMAGGYAFGPVLAIAVTASSTILGSQIAFMIARKYGRRIIHRLAKAEDIEKWDRLADRQGGLFFFFTFVLPIFPSDLMCYVAGLGKVAPRNFLAANIAGRSICAVAMVMIGVYEFRPPWQYWALMAVGAVVFFCWWGIYKRGGNPGKAVRDLANGMWHFSIKKAQRRCGKGITDLKNSLSWRIAVINPKMQLERKNRHENEPV